MLEKVTLSNVQQNKWYKNLLVFIAPVAIVYVVSVIGIINAHNGAVSLQDAIPTPFTLGAMTLYILNSALDYLKKLQV